MQEKKVLSWLKGWNDIDDEKKKGSKVHDKCLWMQMEI